MRLRGHTLHWRFSERSHHQLLVPRVRLVIDIIFLLLHFGQNTIDSNDVKPRTHERAWIAEHSQQHIQIPRASHADWVKPWPCAKRPRPLHATHGRHGTTQKAKPHRA